MEGIINALGEFTTAGAAIGIAAMSGSLVVAGVMKVVGGSELVQSAKKRLMMTFLGGVVIVGATAIVSWFQSTIVF